MDLNRCEFIGRLGSDPISRFTAGGTPVTSFSIAVNKSWMDKKSGQKQESTQWIRIVAFRRLAEICGQYLHKGSRVFIAGEFQSRSWQDGDSAKRLTEVVAREMLMLDSKPQLSATYSQHQSWGQTHPGYKSKDDDLPD